ncbi:MAG: redoxin domain-containing protein [Planctomycetia bacterium]|nr:redoxin domain-containing protein [Planctomycetia bacterium]
MRLRPDIVIFAVLLLGAGYAVYTQLEPRAEASPIPRIGTRIDDFTLKDIGHRDRSLTELSAGKKATVLYFWSVDCPCVDALEIRLKKTIAKYAPLGVEFIAVDSHPDDTRDQVFEKMGRIRATDYRMLLDPKQDVIKRAGARTATEIVILDAERRIRYRGSFDDDFIKPKQEYLGPALDAILQGRDPVPAETKPYGCPFPGFEGLCAFD